MPSAPVFPRKISVGSRHRSLDYIYAPGLPHELCTNSQGPLTSSDKSLEQTPRISYQIHNIHRANFECVALLDVSVRNHLQHKPFLLPAVYPAHTYEIRRSSGKGLGMFATHEIPPGGIILIEHPVLVLADCIQLSAESSPLELYAMLFNRLPDKILEDSMSLSNVKSVSECSRVEGIMRTNALAIDIPMKNEPSRRHWGLFLKTSRCNHRYAFPTSFIYDH